jgi:Dullard-like phosphatase family protein
MSTSFPKKVEVSPSMLDPEKHYKNQENQNETEVFKSLFNLSQTLENPSEFTQCMKKLLPLIPNDLHAVLNVDVISLLLLSSFPIYFHSFSLIKSHYSSILVFLSSIDQVSYNLLQNKTKDLLSFNFSFISSLSPKSLSMQELSIIFVCSELFNLVQRIPLALVLDVIGKVSSWSLLNGLPSVFDLICNKTAPFLPSYSHKKFTLVLDLDETLGHLIEGNFLKRPGVEIFLNEMSKIYELVLFTASSKEYADSAMKIVDPEGLVLLRLYREHLVSLEVKDLQMLGRDLDKVIIIDNFPKAFEKQPKNGIQIKPWLGDMEDQELMKLIWPLREIPFVQGKGLLELIEIINARMGVNKVNSFY